MSQPAVHVPEAPAPLPRAVELVHRAARALQLNLAVLDPEYGHLFRLSRGARSIDLLGGRSPLNDAVASRLAEDKFYTAILLQREGIRVPESVRCLKPGHFEHERCGQHAGTEPGRSFARAHGYPVVVKPNRLSHGRRVFVAYDATEVDAAIQRIWTHDYIALVQEPVPGIDLRLDFLHDEYLAGYYRFPAQPTAEPDELQILNLARGARAEPVEHPAPEWLELGCRIGSCLRLKHLGIDFRIPSRDAPPDTATVIEVNASPLLVQIHEQGFAETALRAQTRVLEAIWMLAR